MKFLFVFALFHPILLGGLAKAERKLPADLQVDLIFPRNETYAPTELLPIIFGLNNLDAVWPLDMHLSVRVLSTGVPRSIDRPYWATQYISLYYSDLQAAFEQATRKQFFHFPAINMTTISNGTLNSFIIAWDVSVPLQCVTNKTQSKEDQEVLPWSDEPIRPYSRTLQFSTAPGAQLPDIEATINSCSERNGDNSAAVRVTDVKTTPYSRDACVVGGAAIRPDKCVFKSAAKELAANVSTKMLLEMGCDEGDWRTITERCPWKEKSMALSQSAGFGVGWLLALAFAVSHVL